MNLIRAISTLAIAAILFFPIRGCMPTSSSGPQRYYGYGRMGDMKQVGLGLLMYAGDHDGRFPDELWALQDEGILGASLLASPADLPDAEPDKTGLLYRYHYFGAGLSDDLPIPDHTPLLIYPFESNGQYHVTVLFIDAHVEFCSDLDLGTILAMTINAYDYERKEIKWN